ERTDRACHLRRQRRADRNRRRSRVVMLARAGVLGGPRLEQVNVDDLVTGEEAAIRDSQWSLIDATKLLVERSPVVGLGALRAGGVPVPVGGPIVLVISGGNAAQTGIADVAGT